MQTILLLPVIPDGVLQLGSLETVSFRFSNIEVLSILVIVKLAAKVIGGVTNI